MNDKLTRIGANMREYVLVIRLPVLVVVLGLAEVSRTPVNASNLSVKRAIVGESIQLNCSTQNRQFPDWTHSSENSPLEYVCANGNLVNGFSTRYEIDHKNEFGYHLIIPRVQLKDTGIFTCTENGGLGAKLTRVNLIVSRQPFEMQPNKTCVVPAGGDLRVKCVTGLDKPVDFLYCRNENEQHVRLYANEFIVNSFGGRVNVDVDHQSGTYQLVVRNITVAMSGVYMCVEDAGLGPGSEVVNVRVARDTNPRQDDAVRTTSEPFLGASIDDVWVLVCIVASVVTAAVVIAVWSVRQKRMKERHVTCTNEREDESPQEKRPQYESKLTLSANNLRTLTPSEGERVHYSNNLLETVNQTPVCSDYTSTKARLLLV